MKAWKLSLEKMNKVNSFTENEKKPMYLIILIFR